MTEDVPELTSGEGAAMEPTGGAFGVNSGSEAARRYDVDRTRGTSGKCSVVDEGRVEVLCIERERDEPAAQLAWLQLRRFSAAAGSRSLDAY